jgi:hypothetical protein
MTHLMGFLEWIEENAAVAMFVFSMGLFAAYFIFSGDEEKKRLCPPGQRSFAELAEQKTEAGATVLKIIFICRERE